MLHQDFDDSADDVAVLGDIFGEDEDVIQVHDHLPFGDKVSEVGVHHRLEGGQAIAQAK